MKQTFAIWMLIASVLAGCQYSFEGSNPPLPSDAKTLHIAPIENQTFEADLDTQILQAIRSRLRDNSAVTLLPTAERSELQLTVQLLTLSKQNLDEPEALGAEVKLTLVGSVLLEDLRTGEEIVEQQPIRVVVSSSSNDGQDTVGLSGLTLSRGMEELRDQFVAKIYRQIFYTF
jgi:hypothetical protein